MRSQLDTAQGALSAAEERAQDLESQLGSIRDSSATLQQDLEAARSMVEERHQQLDQLTASHAEITATLSSRSHDDSEVEALRESLAQKDRAIEELQSSLAAAQTKATQSGSIEQELRVQLAVAQKEREERHTEVLTLMDRLVECEDRLKAAISEKKAAVK